MFDFFKKKEVNNLDTPKNLPELAKDIFEPSQGAIVGQDVSNKDAAATDAKVQPQKEQQMPVQRPPRESYKLPNMPPSSDVPRLDLGLIRSANIAPPNAEIPEEPPINVSRAIDDSRAFSLAEQFNAINRLRTEEMLRNSSFSNHRINQMPVGQRNIYINKGNALFDELEYAIGGNNPELARNIISNILPLLYEYHEIDSMNDVDRIAELKDLEKFWTMLQKRNYAVKSMIDSIESDIVRKSNMLMSGGSTNISNNISSNLSSNISSAASSSISQSSSIAPSFFPLVKTRQNTKDVAKEAGLSPAYPESVYVQPHERFYFKDGKIASSLRDLYHMLSDISDDTFYHHVSIERNDFANWVKDVLKQYSIAKEIANIYSRRELIEFLKDKA